LYELSFVYDRINSKATEKNEELIVKMNRCQKSCLFKLNR